MSKWVEYQPIIDEIKHEWCNKCNKTCPYNNCKIYRIMQILRRQKAIPHEKSVGVWIKNEHTFWTCSYCNWFNDMNRIKYNFCPNCGAIMKGGAE